MDNFSLSNQNSSKTFWLMICTALVVLMILLGGLTRLTDAGLSIVEWKPVTGVLPPLSEMQWDLEFNKYKATPEYAQHNKNMALDEFKQIFWIEFIHRIAGRITGLIFLLPLLYFYFKGQITNESKPIYFIILLLFALQGFMGWYMVKSGLVREPYVSHFRLATHLFIAFIIYSLIFWQLMRNYFDILITSTKVNFKKIKFFCYLAITVLFIQIYLGGLVAGLNAGLIYNSFPLMGDNFVPHELSLNRSLFQNFNDPVFIQFFHRINAYLLMTVTTIVALLLLMLRNSKLKAIAAYMFIALLTQMLAGIFALLYHVPITLALIHQLGAVFLLSSLLWALYLLKSA